MNLKKIRIYADLTQEEVAKILKVARSSYAIWEQERDFIPLNHLIDFCHEFNISLDYALGLTEEKQYKNNKSQINKDLLAKRLKLIRKINNQTQDEVAKKLRIARASISKYENGLNLPITSYLIGFCKYYNISCDYITGKIEEEIKLEKTIKM